MRRGSKKRVLIVDNNERVLWKLQALLEDAGCDTRTTWSGLEALGLLATKDFDVLLVDDYLPDLHSRDFLERVGRLPRQPWIVVMQCSAPRPGELRRYESLGAVAVVDKRELTKIREAIASQIGAEHLAKPLPQEGPGGAIRS